MQDASEQLWKILNIHTWYNRVCYTATLLNNYFSVYVKTSSSFGGLLCSQSLFESKCNGNWFIYLFCSVYLFILTPELILFLFRLGNWIFVSLEITNLYVSNKNLDERCFVTRYGAQLLRQGHRYFHANISMVNLVIRDQLNSSAAFWFSFCDFSRPRPRWPNFGRF